MSIEEPLGFFSCKEIEIGFPFRGRTGWIYEGLCYRRTSVNMLCCWTGGGVSRRMKYSI